VKLQQLNEGTLLSRIVMEQFLVALHIIFLKSFKHESLFFRGMRKEATYKK